MQYMRDTLADAIGPSRTLTGPEKVGVLLLALGKQRASDLLKKFNPDVCATCKPVVGSLPMT